MRDESQIETVDFLRRCLAGHGRLETIRTHISVVLLAEDRVYKLKRAVRFPFVDFSAPEARLAACEAELALNRRTAPTLYRGVHRITRTPDGGLALDGTGPLVDAVVAMRRFPQGDLFDAMAREGRLTPALVAALAHRIAAFHAAAEISRAHGGAAAMAALVAVNDRALRACGLASAGEADALTARFEAALARHGDRLEARRAAGKVRRCHGDLTLRNICLYEGVPTPFDCLEFDEALATIDVLYDLAFVLMDLWHRGRRDLANLLFNRYLDESDEADGAGLLPFLMATRAVIRAHVTATQAAEAPGEAARALRDEARAYLDLAGTLLAEESATLVAVGGLSGSGKSTFAAALAPWLGAPPGARIVSSDRTRKRLHGVSAVTRLSDSAYAPSVSERVYAAMRDEAARVLATGGAVMLDAVFDRFEAREAVEALARRCGVPFRGVWLQAPAAMLAARIRARRDDPSDATIEVLAAQASRDCGPLTWHRLDARLPAETLRAVILAGCGTDAARAAKAAGGGAAEDLA
ncbi:AAA family ATPase [Methylobacterium nodulans]|uniref:Aminoglycoside phosphotransferase n=1 Tax=Methylobacterium nodulans (strain LMG 21967 / CNCM I-2342 / ORS 2060) TaxID=460265 RepID=B8IVD4_METNO|nr:bifunctional aminoglycoside phosphotransferase/ATP-binding protein [Methylobacterium nodulans]ACL60985.1 aminoglycoside phosphotransferase [Methylobacterium nodulans ORS 2060]